MVSVLAAQLDGVEAKLCRGPDGAETFLLQGMKTLEDNSFPLGETVFYIREIVTRA